MGRVFAGTRILFWYFEMVCYQCSLTDRASPGHPTWTLDLDLFLRIPPLEMMIMGNDEEHFWATKDEILIQERFTVRAE